MASTEYDIRILIAEDDEDDLLIFQELILEGTDWDYYYRRYAEVIVDSATNREGIFKKLAETKYNLIFLDYRWVSRMGWKFLRIYGKKDTRFPSSY